MFFFTSLIILSTLLNIIVYYLRKFQEDGGYGQTNTSPSLSHSLQCRHFSLAEIKSATQNFDEGLIIGRGGFGEVYKGIIDNGATTVAIKRLGFWSKQGAPEFWTEIEMLSKFRHSHLVSLIGYCDDQREMIIVYEYMPGGTLADSLHKFGSANRSLSWVQRLKVCLGVARGLDYLHTGTSIQSRVIHRDVKSSNILLDANWEAKVKGFGLSKVGPAAQTCTHVSTHVKGTFGYMDPEYFLTNRLTRKSDVYAFGVVMFEVLCGRAAVDVRLDEEQWGLAKWVKRSIKEGRLHEIVDLRLNGSILLDCLKAFAQLAEQCLHDSSRKRPTMAEVVTRLEYVLSLQDGTTFSLTDDKDISIGEDYDNQHGIDSSIETEVRDAADGNFSTLNNNDEHAAIRIPSNIRAAKKVTFPKQVQLFFTPTFSERKVLDGSECVHFDFDIISTATDNFVGANKLGEGGFGSVYKGRLRNGELIAVKIWSANSRQGEEEFWNEVRIMGKLRHKNLVRLLGFCVKGAKLLLIYEFVQNGSLDQLLFDSLKRSHFGWGARCKIIRVVARGLLYLHEDSLVPIIHRDIKPSNILIDAEWNPKISDFGLASLQMQQVSECITDRIRGTLRYMAPEYVTSGQFSVKSDVFSFGILVLEIITGQKMISFGLGNDGMDFLRDAWRKWAEGTPFNLVDAMLSIGPNDAAQVVRCIQIGFLCVQESIVDRPSMGSVVRMLCNLATIPQPSAPAFAVRGRLSPSLDDSGPGEYSITGPIHRNPYSGPGEYLFPITQLAKTCDVKPKNSKVRCIPIKLFPIYQNPYVGP